MKNLLLAVLQLISEIKGAFATELSSVQRELAALKQTVADQNAQIEALEGADVLIDNDINKLLESLKLPVTTTPVAQIDPNATGFDAIPEVSK